MENTDTKPKRDFLARPWVQWALAILAVVGTYFGVIGYYESKKEPVLTYYVSKTRTPIVQSGKLENFTVSFMGKTITNDLSGAEIQIWNAGKEDITSDSILKPILLKTPNGETIFSVNVSSTRDVIGGHIYVVPEQKTDEVKISWNILEQKDGIKLQIIYGGKVDLPLRLEGVVKHQKQGILVYEPDSSPYYNYGKLLIIFLVLFTLIVVSLVIAVRGFSKTTQRPTPKASILFILGSFAFVLTVSAVAFKLSMVLWRATSLLGDKPPFGL